MRHLKKLLPLLASFGLGALAAFGLLGGKAASPDLVDELHRRYYSRFQETWTNTYWLGAQTLKLPLDLWIFQEMIHELRPDVLIEAGTASGGSALYFASIFDLIDHGRVITIDIERKPDLPEHRRITYLHGSSVSDQILAEVRSLIKPGETVMVTLDSDHHKEHVLQELRSYGPLVTQGSYLVVEDTNINGHPAAPEFGPGPMEAVDEFLAESDDFEPDRSREKFELTFNPRGYLKRVR